MKRKENTFIKVLRIGLGISLFVGGINGCLIAFGWASILPFSQDTALLAIVTDYPAVIIFLNVVEMLAGALLLLNRIISVALVIIAPLMFNIFAYHIYESPSTIWVGALMLTAYTVLLYHNRNTFLQVLEQQR